MLSQLLKAMKEGLEEADKETIENEVYKSKELEKIWKQAQLKKELKKKHGAKKDLKKKQVRLKKAQEPLKEQKDIYEGHDFQEDLLESRPLEDLDLSSWAKALVYQEVFTPKSRSLRRRSRAKKGGKFIAK